MPKVSEEQVLRLRLMWAEAVIVNQTAAIKDIINAAGNDDPYSFEELERSFGESYAIGADYLEHYDIGEIS